jgi:hypothetical protein
VKLAAKRMTAIAAVTSIPVIRETKNGEYIRIMPRIRDILKAR